MAIFGDLGHPELLPLIKTYSPGSVLFRQGDQSNSMILVMEGSVGLYAEEGGKARLVSLVESGQVLGEKLVLGKEVYPRALTAHAANLVTVIELKASDIDELAHNSPDILRDLLFNVIQVLSQRFDRSNRLVSVLRSSDNRKRLIHLIDYLADTLGVKGKAGIEVLIPMATIQFYIEMSPDEVSDLVGELVEKGLLVKKGDVRFAIPDRKSLLAAAESPIEKQAS